MKQNRKIITSILLLIVIGLGILEIFNIEKKKINEENSQIREASELPLPSRIIYKNKYNKYTTKKELKDPHQELKRMPAGVSFSFLIYQQ